MYVAGYFSFLPGESEEPPSAALQEVFYEVMYSQLDRHVFYHYGLQVFLTKIIRRLKELNIHSPIINYNALARHFYNRQLIVQMTAIPKRILDRSVNIPEVVKEKYISIPLSRSPNIHLQADIVYLQDHQKTANSNMRFLLVIIDIYSRFIWVHQVGAVTARKVSAAFGRALSRPGLSLDYYQFIKDKVTLFTVDGGSEFKDVFPETVVSMFNANTKIQIAKPKAQTFGRPTTTGPIEAANRMLRRVLRDYSLGVRADFLNEEAFPKVLDTYNEMKQKVTLHNKSPVEVVQLLLTNNQDAIHTLTNHMKRQQLQKLAKKTKAQKMYPVVESNRQGEAYRLFINPGMFAKEVDIRVSMETYFIDTFTTRSVNLKQ